MKILDIRALRGPNIYHNRPVLLMKLNLLEKAEVGSHEIPDFTDRLIEILPGLWEHHCSPGHHGGFIERLRRGTYFGHIVEHVALELSTLAGIEVSYGKTMYAGEPGVYFVVTRYKNEEAMKCLLEGAVGLVDAIFENKSFEIDALLSQARTIARETALGPSTQSLVDAADKRGIPWRRIGEGSLIQLGYGKNRRRVQAAVSDRTGLIATDLVQDKDLTKKVLAESSIPVPKGIVARDFETAKSAFEKMNPPFAVKPLNGHHGQGVCLNIFNLEDLEKSFAIAREYDSYVLVEKMCQGKDYRLLVVSGELVAAAERVPAHVKGDGKSSIAALIAETNKDPRRGEGHQAVLTQIEIDELLLDCLKRRGHTLTSVPAENEIVLLRENANLSTGGTAVDVTDVVHPAVRLMCERAARAVDLDICGIDLIHTDISQAPNDETAIIEVNAGPGLRMHVAPTEGQPRDVGGMILNSIYPEGTSARIPIVATTGTNGKTTVTRMIAHVLSQTQIGSKKAVVGMTSSDCVCIGGRTVETGDMTGPYSTRLVLGDPTVDIAVLEVARGGLMRGGLGYDWSDVGIVTNIRADHIGQDGIEDIGDIVRVKSVVPERVREGGTIILNADDEEASRLMDIPRLRRIERKVVYYSMTDDNPLIKAHLERGGQAFYMKDGYACEAIGSEVVQWLKLTDLSFTLRGAAWFQVSNAIAAIAACRSMGTSREQIEYGLRSFANGRDNLGRMNIYRVRKGYIILDYAHNPAAIEAMAGFLKALNRKSCAILGLPGDRADRLLAESAKVAAHGFDRLILRDDVDRRGRETGVVPRIVHEKALAERPDLDCEIILDEAEAVKHAIETMDDNEVIVLFFDKYDEAVTALRNFDPVPVESNDEFAIDAFIEETETRPSGVHTSFAHQPFHEGRIQ